MSVCTFFGHRECPETIKPRLYACLEDLILHHGVDSFYVGNHGRFDGMVRHVLKELETQYPAVRYGVVLSCLPRQEEDHCDTMLPEGIENVPPRVAISWRNNWMLERSDYVVCYVTHQWGGAAAFVEKAWKKGKAVINLAEKGA